MFEQTGIFKRFYDCINPSGSRIARIAQLAPRLPIPFKGDACRIREQSDFTAQGGALGLTEKDLVQGGKRTPEINQAEIVKNRNGNTSPVLNELGRSIVTFNSTFSP